MFEIDISDSQDCLNVDIADLRKALEVALQAEQVRSAILSVTIVDNAVIHRMNREYLQHDYPTDVISFQLDFQEDCESGAEEAEEASDAIDELRPAVISSAGLSAPDASGEQILTGQTSLRAVGGSIEGEIIASAEMAVEMAKVGNWSPSAELKLYVIHGMLHLCGYDDTTPEEQGIMRSREREMMARLGLKVVYADETIEEPPDATAGSGLAIPDSPTGQTPGRSLR